MTTMYCNYVDAIRSIDDLSNGDANLSKMFVKQMLVESHDTIKRIMMDLVNESIIAMNILFKAIVVMFGENAPNMRQFCEDQCAITLSDKFQIFNQILELSVENALHDLNVQGNQAIVDSIQSGITNYFQILENELIRLLSENINILSPFNGNDHDVFVLTMMKIKGESKIKSTVQLFQSKCQTAISESINRSIEIVYDSISRPQAPIVELHKIVSNQAQAEHEYVHELQGYTYSDPNIEEIKFFGIRDNCQRSEGSPTMPRIINDDVDYDYVSHLSFYDLSISTQDHVGSSPIEILLEDELIAFENEEQLLRFYQAVFAADDVYLPTIPRIINDDVDYDYVSHLSFYDLSISTQDHVGSSSIEILLEDELIAFENEEQLLRFYQAVFAADDVYLPTMPKIINDDVDYDYVSHLSFHDLSISTQDHVGSSLIEILLEDELIAFENEEQLLRFYQAVFAADDVYLQPTYCLTPIH